MKLRSKNSSLGIAVGDRSIAVAEVAPLRGGRGRWEVRRVAELVTPVAGGGGAGGGIADAGDPTGDPANRAAGEALGRFLRDNGFTPARAVVGVPARWLVAREREVPPASPEQAAEVLRMQADRLFSAELGELAVDYAGAPDASSPRSVLLMAMPRQQLQRVVAMVEAAGCEAVAVMPSTLALAAAGRIPPAAGGAGSDDAADGLVLNLSGDAVELAAHRAGSPRLLRHLPVRGPDLASRNGSPTAAVSSLAGEIRRIVATLPRAADAAGDKRVGPGGDMLRLYDGVGLGPIDADALAQQAGVELRPGGGLAALGLADDDAADAARPDARFADARFAPALALALIGADGRRAETVDFLHPRLAQPRIRRFGRRGAGAVAIAAAVAVALLALWIDVRQTEAELSELRTSIKANEADVAAAKATAARVGGARGWFEARPPMLDALREVTLAFPDGNERVYVTNVTLYEGRRSQISGKAADERGVLAIGRRLLTNPNFADVRMDTRKGGGASNEVGFSISFLYQGAGGAKPEAAARAAGAPGRRQRRSD